MYIYKNILKTLILLLSVCFWGCNYENVQKSENNSVDSSSIVIDTISITSLLNLADSLSNMSNDSSVVYAQKAMELSKAYNYDKGIALSYLRLGLANRRKGNYADAIDNFNKMLENSNEKRIIGLANREIGLSLVYWNKFEEAREYLEKSIDIFLNIESKLDLATVYINYGLLEDNKGEYIIALSFYQKALELIEDLDTPRHKSLIFNNLGVINQKLGMNLIALEQYQQAYLIAEETNEVSLQALFLTNIADAYVKEGKYYEALEVVKKGLEITQKLSDRRISIFLYTTKGDSYYYLGKYETAIENYNIANDLCYNKEQSEPDYLIQLGLGKSFFKMGKKRKALTYLNKALRNAQKRNFKEGIEETNKILAKIYSSLNDYRKAFDLMIISSDMADSISKSKIVKQFTQMEMEYDFNKKQYKLELAQQKANFENKQKMDKQRLLLILFVTGFVLITLLVIVIFYNNRRKQILNLQLKENFIQIKEQNLEIENKNKELKEINLTKDKFFSIIAHDLKSPFNSIIGFSELLVEQISENDLEGIDKYANIIFKSSNRAMNLIMNLMEWSRSQTGRMNFNPEHYEIADLIKNVILVFTDIAKQKSIIITNEKLCNSSVYADKAMISTILRNLISNAIKFTISGGKIIISAEEKQNEVMITVSDTGVGIPKNSINKLFRIDENYSTPGTKNEEGTGLGLILCKEFTEKHNGKIWVESELGKGSKFKFTIPST